MNTHYIFVHGWGTNSDFWSKMTQYFPKDKSHCLNLGFIGPKNKTHKAPENSKRIYITHSLGTLWALKNHIADMDVLIAINGFYRFKNFMDERALQAMKLRLQKSPIPQMDSFWQKCGIPDHRSHFNLHRLQEGLEWLISWNASKELSSLNGPALCMSGAMDLILPNHQMKKEWSGYSHKTHGEGGHVLPWSHPDWCAENIKEFCHGLKLER